ALALFVVREARIDRPLLPLPVVVDRRRGVACLAVVLAIAGIFGAFLSLTYELQVALRLAPLTAGLAFLPLSAATLVGSSGVATRLLPRVAPRASVPPAFPPYPSGRF